MAHETIVKASSGAIWDIVAPDEVTIDPTVNPETGVTTGLRIFIDYTYDQYIHSDGAAIHFIGPASPNPTGKPVPNTFYAPDIVVQTTLEIRNDLGVPMTGINLTLANDDQSTDPGRDTANAHPDDYAHFHQILPTSFSDKLSGSVDNSLVGLDPLFNRAFLGPPQNGQNSPSIIDTFGVIQPDAIGHLGGGNPNSTFTLHSEDTPGPTGGSFTLSWFTLDADPTAQNEIRVFPKDAIPTQILDHAGDGKTYLLAGISSAKIDLPSLAFGDKTTNALAGIKLAGHYGVEPAVFGDVSLGANASVSVQNGIQASGGTLTIEEDATSHLTLNGKSVIGEQSTVAITSPEVRGQVTLNGDLTVGDGFNFLTLGVHLDGKGMMFIQGANDTVTVNAVDGVTINPNAGTLNISHPRDFHGILGPITPQATINLLEAADVTHATFDSSTGLLHLLTGQNADRGDIHLTGNTDGITLNRTLPSDSYLSLQDNGGVGNIAIKFS